MFLNLNRLFTRPRGSGVTHLTIASVADRFKDVFPPVLVIPPPFAAEDEGSLRSVGNDQAVRDMVNLTAETTALPSNRTLSTQLSKKMPGGTRSN